MKQFNTDGIVLSRINFGEADRIVTILTPSYGKLHLIAKGVRRIKSKLAGGIELFSVSSITFVNGRGDIGTLTSTRLISNYTHVVNDIGRVEIGYELMKLLNKITEDNTEPAYFDLLEKALQALDDPTLDALLVRTWFIAQILTIGGHRPNLLTDQSLAVLRPDCAYNFNLGSMNFILQEQGQFTENHIKFLRLLFSHNQPKTLQRIDNLPEMLSVCSPVVQAMLDTSVQV